MACGRRLAPTCVLGPQKHAGQGREQRNVLKQYAETSVTRKESTYKAKNWKKNKTRECKKTNINRVKYISALLMSCNQKTVLIKLFRSIHTSLISSSYRLQLSVTPFSWSSSGFGTVTSCSSLLFIHKRS